MAKIIEIGTAYSLQLEIINVLKLFEVHHSKLWLHITFYVFRFNALQKVIWYQYKFVSWEIVSLMYTLLYVKDK